MPSSAAAGNGRSAWGGGRTRALLMLLLGLSVAVLIGVVAPATSAAPLQLTPPHPAAARTNGARIGDDPVMHPSQHIALAVPGFAPRSAVTVRIACARALRIRPVTGPDGVLHLVFAVPPGLPPGGHLLTFTGPGLSQAGSHAAPAGSIVVTVPEVAFFPFRTGTGAATAQRCP